MGFDPNQPRDKNGEWIVAAANKYSSGKVYTGGMHFQAHEKAIHAGEIVDDGKSTRPAARLISRIERLPVKPSLTTLADSVACFRGVKRPYTDEKDGASILVYVLNPVVTVVRDINMVCLAKAATLPEVALTVQVRPVKEVDLQPDRNPLHKGVITRLEFVPGEGANPRLPKQYGDRYDKRLW